MTYYKDSEKVTTGGGKLPIFSARHSALKWWNKLDERQKNTEICQTFGDGEPLEDNVTINGKYDRL